MSAHVLMSLWTKCQPTPVEPHPGDVLLDGVRYRRDAEGRWIMYNAYAGDWYYAKPEGAARAEAAHVAREPRP